MAGLSANAKAREKAKKEADKINRDAGITGTKKKKKKADA